MKVAVIFENYGPYHHARVAAAQKRLEVIPVELRAVSQTYAWAASEHQHDFEKVTLFAAEERALFSGETVLQRLSQTLREQDVSAVCVNGWGDAGAPSGIYCAIKLGIPLIFMSESTAIDQERQSWRETIKKKIVQLGSAALVGGTRHLAYMAELGMPTKRIFHGYDAIDNSYFSRRAFDARQQPTALRAKLALPERYFLASARFIEKKNLPRLLTAYARYRQMADRAGAWNLVLLGDGEMRPQLEALATELGIQDAVQMPGFKQYQELPAYYGLASAFVHASTVEQWGLVVNEAMASGLPVLVSNRCGCAADLVREGHNGFTFDPYDAEQLAQLFLRISQMSAAERQTMGQHSQHLIAAWGPEAFAAGMQQAVEAALSHPRPRAGWLDRLLLEMLIRR